MLMVRPSARDTDATGPEEFGRLSRNRKMSAGRVTPKVSANFDRVLALGRFGVSDSIKKKFLRFLQWQSALAVENLAKTFVVRAARKVNEFRERPYFLLRGAHGGLEPAFGANGAALRNDRDWVFRFHDRFFQC